MRTLSSAAAQVDAEVRMRLRSPATLIAALAAFGGTLLWIPDPHGRVTSLCWTAAGGRVVAPVYSASYVGYAVATVVTILVTWFGFYLVAGAVRRDGERGVGVILAATPLSRWQYLAGKFAAHAAYLCLVAGMAFAAGLVALLRFGSGGFSVFGFFGLPLAICLPALATTAALALFFDVTPGLRGRFGLAAWFFLFLIVLVAIPTTLAGSTDGVPARFPAFDPAGLATQTWLVRKTIPAATRISTGLIFHDRPIARVPWPGIALPGWVLAARALNFLVALVPLALAAMIFDRFDPARAPRRRRPRARAVPPPLEASARSDAPELAAPSPAASGPLRPTAWAAILAETLLVWNLSGWIRWPLALAALGAAAAPAPAGTGFTAAFFLLLVPTISEAASREEVAGTRGLVFSQPAVPASVVWWKAASLGLFTLALLVPAIARAAAGDPVRGLELACGALCAAALAAGSGWLTGGGKLFSAVFLVLWYAAVSGVAFADFAGAFSPGPRVAVSAAYLAVGVLLLVVASRIKRDRAR